MILGLNVPWFAGQYGHDLGRNPAHPDWPVWYDGAEAGRILEFVSSFGLRHLRIWLFEDDEGLVCDGEAFPVDLERVFEENLADLCRRLKALSFRVYWALFDANACRRRYDSCTFRILTEPEAADAFCSSVLARAAPVIAEVAWAIDLCNEPEAIVAGRAGNGSRSGRRWRELAPCLRVLGEGIRRHLPGVPLSIGSGYRNHLNVQRGVYGRLGLDLDFYDFHSYTQDCSVPAVRVHKPVVVGEFGCPVRESDRASRDCWSSAQSRLARIVRTMNALGYEAAFLWRLSGLDMQDASAAAYAGEAGEALYAIREMAQRGEVAV